MKRSTLFILLLLFTRPTVFAAEPATVIQYDVKCVIENNRCIHYRNVLIEIANKSGEKYTAVSIPYSKTEKLQIENAHIEDQNGNIIRVLKKSDIKEVSEIEENSLYQDRFVKKFELKHNVYPYRIRYQYKYVFDEFHEIIDWYPYLDEKIIVLKAKLEVQMPMNYKVKVFANGFLPAIPDTINSKVVYKFIQENIKWPKNESYSIPIREVLCNVRILPLDFKWFVTGSHSSWKDYGNWIYGLNEGTEDLSEDDKRKVKSLVAGLRDTMEIIETLYQYLQQQTRYINVSIGTGGLKPYPASYVVKNNYGDCKALSVYMKALLNVANITSYYTLINSGINSPQVIHEVPGLQFNHAILTIPVANDTIFLDCTSTGVPVGYAGTFIQGRFALLIKKDGSHLVKVPNLKIKDVVESNKHSYNLSLESNCKVSIDNLYKGYLFDVFSGIKNSLDHTTTERFLKERFMNFPSFELNNWEIKKPFHDSAMIQLNATLELQNFLRSYGNALGFNLYPIYFPAFEKPANRVLPLCFEYPVCKIETFQYRLNSLKAKRIPESIRLESKFGNFTLDATLQDNVLLVSRSLVLNQGKYELSDYPHFYNYIQQVISCSNPTILLTK